MNPLDPQGARALYLQLADELRSGIRRGEIQPGQRLPAERDLAERYDASRTTVRLALGMLKAEGLIGSGPGRGTFVRQRPPGQLAFSRFSRRRREPGMGPWESATRRAGVNGETRMVAVEQQTADAELAYRLGIDDGRGRARPGAHRGRCERRGQRVRLRRPPAQLGGPLFRVQQDIRTGTLIPP